LALGRVWIICSNVPLGYVGFGIEELGFLIYIRRVNNGSRDSLLLAIKPQEY